MVKASAQPATQIRSVARASRLLLQVAGAPDGLAATDAAAALGAPLPTTYHLLTTLRVEGLLAQDALRRFVLGPQVAVLADVWLRAGTFPTYLLVALAALSARTGETTYLAAWREGAIHALASVEGVRVLRVAEAERGPYRLAHARATGKLLLAYADAERRARVLGDGPLEAPTPNTITSRRALERELAAIRARGWSEDHEEFVEGVSCVAAPVLAGDVVVAALTLSCPTQRFERDREILRAAVLDAARGAAANVAHPSPEEAA